MKSLFLAQIGGQLFALDKDYVAGVGIRNDAKLKPLQKNGRQVLPLANGNEALICNLQALLPMDKMEYSRQEYYLVIKYQGRFMALTMTGRGRLVMADEKNCQTLPPTFTGSARRLVPGVLINCSDLVFLLDMAVLGELPDHAIGQ